MVNSNNLTLFVIIADGAADQICETKETAMKERADLIAMGCEVKVGKTRKSIMTSINTFQNIVNV
jgi:hypothetical protein